MNEARSEVQLFNNTLPDVTNTPSKLCCIYFFKIELKSLEKLYLLITVWAFNIFLEEMNCDQQEGGYVHIFRKISSSSV